MPYIWGYTEVALTGDLTSALKELRFFRDIHSASDAYRAHVVRAFLRVINVNGIPKRSFALDEPYFPDEVMGHMQRINDEWVCQNTTVFDKSDVEAMKRYACYDFGTQRDTKEIKFIAHELH